jgi:CRP/FNR family transcriptional regulator
VTERVAAYLCRQAAQAGGDTLELRVTRDELATHVGTVREQASRALAQLKAAGLIDVKARTIVIVEPDALRLMGGAGGEQR